MATRIPFVFGIDATRADLAIEFKRHPYGRHSADLQRLLNRFRSQPSAGDFCLVVIEPHRKWALACFGSTKREGVSLIGPTFSSIQDGEWHVFKLRWQAYFGQMLELE
jgi:hypothetical protein